MAVQDTLADNAWNGIKAIPDMDEDQYVQWKSLLEKRTGMMLSDERRSFLLTNVAIRMREIGCSNYQDYYDHVLNGPKGAIEWVTLVDRLTVHETRFFRHRHSVEYIRQQILPEWLERDSKNVNVWSVGCATGEEPYTLAITIDEYMRQNSADYYLGVIGSDISMASLSIARKGIYDARKLTEMDAGLLNQYMDKVDERRFKVNDELKKRVCFMQLNVLDMKNVPLGKMDLIYCQNLLIYFNRERRMQILDNLASHLSPGGYLILGSGEILGWQPPGYQRITYENALIFHNTGGVQ